MNKVVLFIFYDHKTHKVLSEERLPTDIYYPLQKIFPSGKVKPGEEDNLEKTLLREIKEELNVIPKEYFELKSKMPIIGDNNESILYPFFITKWEGNLPAKVLDKDNILVWETLEEATSSSVKTRGIVVKLIKEFFLT
ncbi:MAG: NUDIX domain-containing protein [bacterium]|nr:NUDIX domain-containing protein [bacterium]